MPRYDWMSCLLIAAFVSIFAPASMASDAISYDISNNILQINGNFSDTVDTVTIRVPMSDGTNKADVPLSVAQEFAGSLFELGIGSHYSVVFGQTLSEEMDELGESGFTDIIYDYASFRGACLRSSNGKLAVMIDLKQGGTANAGNPPDTLFIFSGPGETVLYELISRDDWTDADCLDEARDAAAFASFVRTEQTKMVNDLAPDEIFDATTTVLNVRELATDPRDAINSVYQQYAAFYFPEYCIGKEDFDIEECAKSKSSLAPVFEGPDYDIYRARFIQDCASEGFDFLHDKQNESWVSLTRNPSGCSKYYLCEPEYLAIDGQTLRTNLPLECIHWGDWVDVTIDLTSFEVRQQ